MKRNPFLAKASPLLLTLLLLLWDLPLSKSSPRGHDEDDYEGEESGGTDQVPRFLVSDEEIFSPEHEDVSFVCEVDKLGVYDIMFKEDPTSNNIISVGDKVFNAEYSHRVKLEKLKDDKGMIFVLKNVTKADSGKYACSLNHPAQNSSVIFSLKVGTTPTKSSSVVGSNTGGSAASLSRSFKSLQHSLLFVISVILSHSCLVGILCF